MNLILHITTSGAYLKSLNPANYMPEVLHMGYLQSLRTFWESFDVWVKWNMKLQSEPQGETSRTRFTPYTGYMTN